MAMAAHVLQGDVPRTKHVQSLRIPQLGIRLLDDLFDVPHLPLEAWRIPDQTRMPGQHCEYVLPDGRSSTVGQLKVMVDGVDQSLELSGGHLQVAVVVLLRPRGKINSESDKGEKTASSLTLPSSSMTQLV
jgi:hypothetical protein